MAHIRVRKKWRKPLWLIVFVIFDFLAFVSSQEIISDWREVDFVNKEHIAKEFVKKFPENQLSSLGYELFTHDRNSYFVLDGSEGQFKIFVPVSAIQQDLIVLQVDGEPEINLPLSPIKHVKTFLVFKKENDAQYSALLAHTL